MKVIVFGATGMVGQGVLRECLRDPAVTDVLVVGRTRIDAEHPKLKQLVHRDLAELMARDDTQEQMSGYDACFFNLGVSSFRMTEDDYRRVTYDLTLTVARALSAWNPGLTFVYVSGRGTDSTEKGRVMWARVKGRTENDLLALPMNTYLFRPGYIQPLHGIRSKTRLYRALYVVAVPLFPLIRRLAPEQVTTTEQLGRAMINVATDGAPVSHLETKDINKAAA
ncbi:Rossmann-fold NAD(P)-binding domain-containing protein [Streptomyces lasiicapitis]|uniref:epimerase n=1 Tax=Streptomyces lasiicapitis TaxID=1923961 RepID=UPI00365E0B9B